MGVLSQDREKTMTTHSEQLEFTLLLLSFRSMLLTLNRKASLGKLDDVAMVRDWFTYSFSTGRYSAFQHVETRRCKYRPPRVFWWSDNRRKEKHANPNSSTRACVISTLLLAPDEKQHSFRSGHSSPAYLRKALHTIAENFRCRSTYSC